MDQLVSLDWFQGQHPSDKMLSTLTGAIIFSLYIVYDTQLMMGGKHKYSLSPEEYIFASLNIYMDIVNLFLYILTIVNAASSDWSHLTWAGGVKNTNQIQNLAHL